MKSIHGLVAVVLAATWAAPAAHADEDTRCGSTIVSVGMTKSDVLSACGEPVSKEDASQAVRDGNMVVGTSTTSRWTYTSGAVKTVFVFDADKLIDIHVD